MKLRTLFLALALIALVGCSQQPEYGPKAEPRYTATWLAMKGVGGGCLRLIRDATTGEEWLVYSDSVGTTLLRHTGGTDDRR